MKKYEKKSFFTTLFLFFVPLLLLSSIVLYMYHQDKIQDIEQNILYQMKDYTFDFKGDKFSLDIIENDKEKQLFKIYHCKEGLCAYFQTVSTSPYLLKIVYDKEKYKKLYNEFLIKIFKFSIIVLFSLFIISIGFAIYSLRPIREALYLLENFLKDIIHDLNTPATSILLNSKLLRKRGNFEEIERIELSAQSIASLYKNLEFMNPNNIQRDENVSIEEIVNGKIEILQKIYPKIYFTKDLTPLVIKSNQNGIERIIDNIITNACKYNKKNGQVHLSIHKNKLIIKDTGIGIKNTKKVFQRHYKENTLGLGIGMSIVKQLCEVLNIGIEIKSTIGEGTQVTLEFP
ncbi:HAMP domain-containing histidine kinase [Poseidonibacter lekithochrous]|uniref:sensor histidine kinase n=1 Tax=Poseidonibacter TaxID=2321187 RepID=UPI001C086B62|nr:MULTISPECIES: HAMP domain-containing sensor histidine kinase [Poseidonibacter]MBU3015548.1 HAMP domain-containing histidine kinase [Poseidonibacter lekithochrous]MDO6828847.1 HAMP domain-containing sensor histidine kinase [Poseidonibacter sp. 1_MG-2023]